MSTRVLDGKRIEHLTENNWRGYASTRTTIRRLLISYIAIAN